MLLSQSMLRVRVCFHISKADITIYTINCQTPSIKAKPFLKNSSSINQFIDQHHQNNIQVQMEKQALQSLSSLEERIANKQSANLQVFQKEILEELKTIRATLVKDSAAPIEVKALDEGDKDKRITELQNENRRLSYRIIHLARNFREALNKQ